MDALAAYGSDSDDSGTETTSTYAPSTIKTATSAAVGGAKISSLSSMLPPPKSQSATTTATAAPRATIASIPKTSKYHTLPTLDSDTDSDDESEFRKKAKLADAAKNAGSGVGALFAMLPAPKSGTSVSASESGSSGKSSTTTAAAKPSFMPRTVKKPVVTAAHKKPALSEKDAQADNSDDDDDDSEMPVSFFPLGAAATATPKASSSASGKAASNSYIPLFFGNKPLTTEEKQVQNQVEVNVSATNEQYAYPGNDQYAYHGSEQYAYATNDQYAYPTNDQYAYQGEEAYAAYGQQTQSASTAYNNVIELDNVGLQKLGMRKARDMPINVIDVSARDQMSQAQHVRAAVGASGGNAKPVDLSSIEHLKPTAGQKRKHNIMSLAYQAKANEQQLNAAWSASRRTKAETQSKYGF
ncbi:hypothetical protein EDD11_001986 [Mortierella claussenii]|nr:hypothetical protein EDD11_001986 [Mortierella claussenii]